MGCSHSGWDLAGRLKRLTVNAEVATVLGSIPSSFDRVESEGRQMKQCCVNYWKIKKSPFFYKIITSETFRQCHHLAPFPSFFSPKSKSSTCLPVPNKHFWHFHSKSSNEWWKFESCEGAGAHRAQFHELMSPKDKCAQRTHRLVVRPISYL